MAINMSFSSIVSTESIVFFFGCHIAGEYRYCTEWQYTAVSFGQLSDNISQCDQLMMMMIMLSFVFFFSGQSNYILSDMMDKKTEKKCVKYFCTFSSCVFECCGQTAPQYVPCVTCVTNIVGQNLFCTFKLYWAKENVTEFAKWTIDQWIPDIIGTNLIHLC